MVSVRSSITTWRALNRKQRRSICSALLQQLRRKQMANCPKCGKEMVESDTKKKGMTVLKHKEEADQKSCGVKFIPVRGGGSDGGKKEVETSKETPSSYAAAVSGVGSPASGKARNGGEGKKHVQQPAVQQHTAAPAPARTGGKSYREYLKDEFGL